LGLTFDKTGHLNFDQSVFGNVSAAHPADVSAFLGSASTGGFLKSATDILNGLEAPVTGTLESTIASAQTAIDSQNRKISDAQDRLDILTASLTAKIDAADALIASLEQQQSYFTTLFTDMNAINKNQG
jgi:flagellar capping protein FliD